MTNGLMNELAERAEFSPERELWVAVMLQALEDLKTLRKMSVMHFFCSAHFNEICTLLDYDVDFIRNKYVPTDVQQRLTNTAYTMPPDLLTGEGKPGRPRKHQDSYYMRRKQREAQRQQPEQESDLELFGLELVNEVDTFSYVPEPVPIVFKQQFDSRSVGNVS